MKCVENGSTHALKQALLWSNLAGSANTRSHDYIVGEANTLWAGSAFQSMYQADWGSSRLNMMEHGQGDVDRDIFAAWILPLGLRWFYVQKENQRFAGGL